MTASAGSRHVCVVGSGPAGMVLALELADLDCRVTLVESGTTGRSSQAQGLSEAVFGVGHTHASMDDAVQRRWGGTSHIWGGRCVPFDPADLKVRDGDGDPVWPLTFQDLSIHFGKACRYADCGPPEFTLDDLRPEGAFAPIAEGFVDGDVRSDQIERWSASPVMVSRLGRDIAAHPRISVMTGSTCTGVNTTQGGRGVSSIEVRPTAGGEPALLEADVVVLACGGVESTRLLLHFIRGSNALCVEGRAFLGRGYMGHLFGKIAGIRFLGDPARTSYSFYRVKNHYVRRRFTLSERVRETRGLLNICFWLDNPPAWDPSHGSGILSAAYLAMKTPMLGDALAPAGIRKAFLRGDRGGSVGRHLRNLASGLPAAVVFATRFLYGRYWAPAPRFPGFFVFNPANRYGLQFHSEQSAQDYSRIELDESVDRLGVPRAKLSLRFARSDAQSVVDAHDVLDAHLRSHKIGELEYWVPEAERVDAVLRQANDGFHQIGTTRMATGPDRGVADAYGRVFGPRNLFVCSSSLFPSSGQANPTLTLLAFAVRQAEFIAGSLRGELDRRGAGQDATAPASRSPSFEEAAQ